MIGRDELEAMIREGEALGLSSVPRLKEMLDELEANEEKRDIMDWCSTCKTAPSKELIEERARWCRDCMRETIALKIGEVVKPASWDR